MDRFRAGALILLLVTLTAGSSPAAPGDATEIPLQPPAPGRSIVTLETRPGVTVRLLLVQPGRPLASALIFPGGTGAVGIHPARVENGDGLLLRERERFAAQGILVAIADLSSDHDGPGGLTGLRTTEQHAEDAVVTIRFLRRRSPVPVWVVGASRGTASAVNAAARIEGPSRPDGIVLVSSLLRTQGEADRDGVFEVPLERVRGPVLLVHHEQDACPATSVSDLPRLMQALRNARPLEVRRYSGGGPVLGAPCTAQHHHGFVGLEVQVVSDIGDWIVAHSARKAVR